MSAVSMHMWLSIAVRKPAYFKHFIIFVPLIMWSVGNLLRTTTCWRTIPKDI